MTPIGRGLIVPNRLEGLPELESDCWHRSFFFFLVMEISEAALLGVEGL